MSLSLCWPLLQRTLIALPQLPRPVERDQHRHAMSAQGSMLGSHEQALTVLSHNIACLTQARVGNEAGVADAPNCRRAFAPPLFLRLRS